MTLLDTIDLDTLSPMMQQYVEQKRKWPDAILFFRLGDFYEMFFDDAITASRELEITLTSRDCGQQERAPMCGVPYHAADTYIARLIAKNYKVAICEQMEDPSKTKGLVKREVVRVITPGTITDPKSLDDQRNNFICSVYQLNDFYGLAACDITTGEFEAQVFAVGATADKLADALDQYHAAEIVCNEAFARSELAGRLVDEHQVTLSPESDQSFAPENWDKWLDIGEPSRALWAEAASGLLSYLGKTQGRVPEHLHRLWLRQPEDYMTLDQTARRNLELTETLRDKQRRGSLLWVLDHCQTAMGSRLIRRWIEQPLLNLRDIRARQEAVGELKDAYLLRKEFAEVLKGMNDIERLAGKVSMGQVNAHDLLQLGHSLGKLPALRDRLETREAGLLKLLHKRIDPLDDSCSLIESAIAEDAPVSLTDGGIIREGYDSEVDRLRETAHGGQQWIIDLEARERESTGIRNLKIGYNKVFGYYIEVTKSNLDSVPDHYTRKQTLVNAERYITEELKGMEDSILGANARQMELEYDVFCRVRDEIKAAGDRISRSAAAVAELDVLVNLAEVAETNNYNCPEVAMDDRISIKDGRHPVVERLVAAGSFVPNDTEMNEDDQRLLLVTGPNMAGKSTYMRQVALIVIMAQMGSFVPASSAHIGLADRVFTRIGASDDLAGGDSTFMVEMKEMARILREAKRSSLLILDEVGRGTSTYDGLSIAWAMVEAIVDPKIGSRTLFATHYHELTDLEQTMPGVRNYHSTVEQQGQEIVFLHRIVPGGSDESYGIDVARLAGVPETVVARARELLRILEEANSGKKKLRIRKQIQQMEGQQDLFSAQLTARGYDEIMDELKGLNVQQMTPLDALNRLYDLSEKAKNLK